MDDIRIIQSIDAERLRRALGAAYGHPPHVDQRGGSWLSLSPGLGSIKLALAVVSKEYADYLRARSLSADDREALNRITSLPEGEALRLIETDRWRLPPTPDR